MDLAFFITSAIKIVMIAFVTLLPMVAYAGWAERRFAAIIQDRVGPNRTGIPLTLFGGKKDLPFAGLLQPMADGLKFILKEDFTPKHVRTFYYWLAPCLTLVPAFLMVAVVPFGSNLHIPFTEITVPVVIADLNIGPLWIFAVSSIGVYGIVLAGYGSNSKYPFLGGIRASSQMISYEIALGLSVVPVLMVFGELNLGEIVRYQDAHGWLLAPFWGDGVSLQRWVLLVPLFISFIVFTTSIFAETNRLPFDLAECETELVGGFHTEYSSMKFALFFLGEYAAMIIGSGLIVTLFFGGWSIPFGDQLGLTATAAENNVWIGLLHIFSFLTKVVLFILFFIWVRWTLPRFRYDQLMKLGWVFFFEIALVNVLLTAAILMWVK